MVDGRPRQCRCTGGRCCPGIAPGIRVWPATFCSRATRAKVLHTVKYRREDLNLHDLAVTEFSNQEKAPVINADIWLDTQRMNRGFAADLNFIGELMTRLARPYEHSWK